MAGYIGSKTSVTQVDGYNRTEADAEFVSKDGDTITTAAGTALTLDRTGSDGTILDLKKDGSTVGSIGNASTNLIVEATSSNRSGLSFGGSVTPRRGGANSDNTTDLGTSSIRFKDLYLSGGIQFDSRSNKLDDYEEGTFQPSVAFGGTTPAGLSISSATGGYTKVGRLVTCTFGINASWTSSASGGAFRITGLPFTESRGGGYIEPGLSIGNKNLASFTHGAVVASSTEIVPYQNGGPTQYTGSSFNNAGASGFWFHGSLVYFTA